MYRSINKICLLLKYFRKLSELPLNHREQLVQPFNSIQEHLRRQFRFILFQSASSKYFKVELEQCCQLRLMHNLDIQIIQEIQAIELTLFRNILPENSRLCLVKNVLNTFEFMHRKVA